MATAPRGKRIKLDKYDTSLVVDDSWLDKPVSEWPEGVLFRVNHGIYARTMMNDGEAKVSCSVGRACTAIPLYTFLLQITFGSYSDGSLDGNEMCELYWNRKNHSDQDPPTGTLTTPVRLDASVTLNIVEHDEMRKLIATDIRADNYFLSEDTAVPFKRGRVLTKVGRYFKLSSAGMYGK